MKSSHFDDCCCVSRYRVVEHSERPFAYAIDWLLQRIAGIKPVASCYHLSSSALSLCFFPCSQCQLASVSFHHLAKCGCCFSCTIHALHARSRGMAKTTFYNAAPDRHLEFNFWLSVAGFFCYCPYLLQLTKRCRNLMLLHWHMASFDIWQTLSTCSESAILNFQAWKFPHSTISILGFCDFVQNFAKTRQSAVESYLKLVFFFQYGVCPSYWVSGDIIILHPVIDFRGPNILLNFLVDWFGRISYSLTYSLLATDRQTYGPRHRISLLTLFVATWYVVYI